MPSPTPSELRASRLAAEHRAQPLPIVPVIVPCGCGEQIGNEFTELDEELDEEYEDADSL